MVGFFCQRSETWIIHPIGIKGGAYQKNLIKTPCLLERDRAPLVWLQFVFQLFLFIVFH